MMQPQIPLPRSHAEPPLLSSLSSNSAPTSIIAPAVAVTALSFPHLCHSVTAVQVLPAPLNSYTRLQFVAALTTQPLHFRRLAPSLFSLSQNVAPLSATHRCSLSKLPFPVSECDWPSLSLHCQHRRRLPCTFRSHSSLSTSPSVLPQHSHFCRLLSSCSFALRHWKTTASSYRWLLGHGSAASAIKSLSLLYKILSLTLSAPLCSNSPFSEI